jgi:GNAT superfamily N-acetyltransferase
VPYCTVRVAGRNEYDRLGGLYARWGYRGGILTTDVAYVAVRAGEIVGLVRRTEEFGYTMLRGMYVDPIHQRRGVGMTLLQALVDGLGASECLCVPLAHLVRFYGAGGFAPLPIERAPPFLVERSAQYRAQGLDVLVMRRAPDAGQPS